MTACPHVPRAKCETNRDILFLQDFSFINESDEVKEEWKSKYCHRSDCND